MTVGNLIAIQQTSVKRMLAYSSIAQAGYILIAIPVATDYAVAGGLLHVLTHAAMKSGAFFVLVAIAVVGLGEKIDDFNGLSKRSPFLAFAMAAFVLSLAGIPPLAGFYSKFVLFSAAIEASATTQWLVWLAVAGILNSALSLFYYARIIKAMYVDESPSKEPIKIPTSVAAVVCIALVVTILIGLFPEPFVNAALGAADSLSGLLPLGR
jgi:NADH:ubiquinone oxidoreductase subunit 2 (subunit N)